MNITQRMLYILSEKNLKQKDLAEHIDIPTSTISTWKNTGKNPPSEKIAEIADYLGVSVYYLLGLTDDPLCIEKHNGYVMKANQTNSSGNNVINNTASPAKNNSELDKHDRELLEEYHKLSFKNKAKVMNLITELEEDNN